MVFVLVLLLGVGTAFGQGVTGRVTDAHSGLPLPGVTVMVRNTPRGTTTDRNGRYYLDNLQPGLTVIVARAVGYTPQEQFVTIDPYRTDTLSFRLAPEVVELDQVEVVALRLDQQRDTQPALVSLDVQDTRSLPGAGEDVLRALQSAPGVLATSDFSSQIVVRGGGPDENLIVLDGVEVFNPYRLYGVVSMFNPAVVSDIRLMTGGFPGNYGDRLSSVLDVVSRDGTDREVIAGSVNASITNAGLVLEGKTGVLDGSWTVTGRRTYYDLLLGLVARRFDFVGDRFSFPSFADLQSRLILRPASGHKVQAGMVTSRDALDVVVDGEELTGSRYNELSADDRTLNDVLYGSWHWAPSAHLLSRLTASWYRNSGDLGSDGQFIPRDHFEGNRYVLADDTLSLFEFSYAQQFRFEKTSLRHELALQSGAHLVEAGVGIDLLDTKLFFDLDLNEVGKAYWQSIQNNNPSSPGAFPEKFDQLRSYRRLHAYVQDRFRILGGKLFVQPGFRFDHYGVIGRSYASPRLNFSVVLDPLTTIRGAWGIYRQSPGFEKLVDRVEVYDLSQGGGIENLQAEKATHYVLGLTRWLDDRWRLSIESYYKGFDDLIVQQRALTSRYIAAYVGNGSRISADSYELRRVAVQNLTSRPINDASGRAYGIEIALEKKYLGRHDHVSGWASYAWAHTNRTRTNPAFRNETIESPFEYDRRHVVNAAFEYRLGDRWRLGFTFRFGTGFPYTPAIGYAPLVVARANPQNPLAEPVYEILVNQVTKAVRFEMLYGDEQNLNSARMPDYHRLDVRLSRTLHFKGLDGSIYLDVINVYNHRNVMSYSYAVAIDPKRPEQLPTIRRQQTNMLPILPTVGLSFNF